MTEGLNTYDFGARTYIPDECRFWQPDPKAHDYHWLSPYAYCGGDPINYVDPDGKVIIFVNGMHFGDGGSSEYWGGVDQQIKVKFSDNNALYYDGSLGGKEGLPDNLNPETRQAHGFFSGLHDAPEIVSNLADNEKIKIITHSMGASFAKGFISGLKSYLNQTDINITDIVDFEVDLAPFQPKGQKGQEGVKTITIQHYNDCIALPVDMPNAENYVTRKDVLTMIFNLFKEHSITTFIDDINNLELYLEDYK